MSSVQREIAEGEKDVNTNTDKFSHFDGFDGITSVYMTFSFVLTRLSVRLSMSIMCVFLHTAIEFRIKLCLFLFQFINIRPILFVSTLNYYCNALKFLSYHKFRYYYSHKADNSSHNNSNKKKLFRYSCTDDYLIGRNSFPKANANQDKYFSHNFKLSIKVELFASLDHLSRLWIYSREIFARKVRNYASGYGMTYDTHLYANLFLMLVLIFTNLKLQMGVMPTYFHRAYQQFIYDSSALVGI